MRVVVIGVVGCCVTILLTASLWTAREDYPVSLQAAPLAALKRAVITQHAPKHKYPCLEPAKGKLVHIVIPFVTRGDYKGLHLLGLTNAHIFTYLRCDPRLLHPFKRPAASRRIPRQATAHACAGLHQTMHAKARLAQT